MGSGSTIAAAEAVSVRAIGVERYAGYFEMSKTAIPQLAAIQIKDGDKQQLSLPLF
jgi:site-specific DNA-methyltransferase (adenine-specific)